MAAQKFKLLASHKNCNIGIFILFFLVKNIHYQLPLIWESNIRKHFFIDLGKKVSSRTSLERFGVGGASVVLYLKNTFFPLDLSEQSKYREKKIH